MKFAKLLTVLCLVIALTAIPMIVSAAPMNAQAPAPATLDDLFATLKNLGGVALLFTALINAGKKFGWVTDGNAPAVSLGMNAFGLLALVALQFSGKIDLVPSLDQGASSLANLINDLLALVFQIFVSRVGHNQVLAGLPLVGKSFSGRRAGEGPGFADFEIAEIQ